VGQPSNGATRETIHRPVSANQVIPELIAPSGTVQSVGTVKGSTHSESSSKRAATCHLVPHDDGVFANSPTSVTVKDGMTCKFFHAAMDIAARIVLCLDAQSSRSGRYAAICRQAETSVFPQHDRFHHAGLSRAKSAS